MTERATRFVDDVLPRIPLRQWVLSLLPYRLPYCSPGTTASGAPSSLAVERGGLPSTSGGVREAAHRADGPGLPASRMATLARSPSSSASAARSTSTSTSIPSSSKGVFSDLATGSAPFHPASPPSDEAIARLLATILVRVRRLLRRRGLDRDDYLK